MANMVNIEGLSFNPRENTEWYTRALFGGSLIQRGLFRLATGIKNEQLLNLMEIQDQILQKDGLDCAWTPNKILKLSEKTASVTTYKINLEQCLNELENRRTAYMMGDGARNEALPAEMESAWMQLIAISTNNEIEELLIGGNSSVNPNQFDGLERILSVSTEAERIAGTTLTKANIIAEMEKVYDKIKEEVLQNMEAGTLVMFYSFNARRLLSGALSALGKDKFDTSLWAMDKSDPKNPTITYNGIELVPVKGIGKNTIIAGDTNNWFLLTDLMSDLESMELGQFPKPNDDKVFIKGRLRVGTVVIFEDECVIYSPSVTSQVAGVGQVIKLNPNILHFPASGGDAQTFSVTTIDTTAVLEFECDGSTGYEVTKGTTTGGVTVFTVTPTSDNVGHLNPRTAQVIIRIEDSNDTATVMLTSRSTDIPAVVA